MTAQDIRQLPPAEKAEAVRAKLRAMGIHVPTKEARARRLGRMKDCELFERALRLGAEWRAEENHKSIEELDAHS